MNTQINPLTLDSAVEAVQKKWPDAKPKCGLILGSGWGEAIADLQGKELAYAQIPGFGQTGVMGHAGKLLSTEISGMEAFIFQGRRHWYEGEGWTPVILPVYLLHALGAETILLTNASGGIRDDLGPGSLMAISDHINMLGSNPLIGPYNPRLGTRFPDQSEIYAKPLRKKLLQAGADAEGVYIATSGPTFETPAEINQYRAMGADAVGMSTVPEAVVANALGMRVAGLSCICNWAAGISPTKLTHEDVNQTAAEAMPRMKKTITRFLEKLAGEA
ncbi:purine-nucleoside phosphorylase [Pontiella sulfatireligans]|uniref:Purine nucleoside phosphorylase n=1 Tax=Pontiella sulfatireligans TaxID=2750658 RepID=A0A6C2UK87_9BACT|nr:purine-nucleoside phosphorylase [Pontiella sulfatireligans]VGO19821.1 Purine nucleoside phosphorylase 1 [Pontiella sulfatireligans]